MRGVDLLGQLVGVGRAQLGEAAVLHDDPRQLELFGQLFEHVFSRRRLTGRRLALDGQAELAEQHFLQLLRRFDVEWLARCLVRAPFQLDQSPRQLAALLAQHLRVDQYTAVLHVEQHRHQRLLDLAIQSRE